VSCPRATCADESLVGQIQQARGSSCSGSTTSTVAARITPAVIDFINANRTSRDPLCHETLPGSGFQACF